MNVLGYILAAYCVIKMLLCAKAAVFGEDFSSDPASRALSLLLRVTSGGAVHINTQVRQPLGCLLPPHMRMRICTSRLVCLRVYREVCTCTNPGTQACSCCALPWIWTCRAIGLFHSRATVLGILGMIYIGVSFMLPEFCPCPE